MIPESALPFIIHDGEKQIVRLDTDLTFGVDDVALLNIAREVHARVKANPAAHVEKGEAMCLAIWIAMKGHRKLT